MEELKHDILSRIWITYRKNFSPIGKLCILFFFKFLSVIFVKRVFIFKRLNVQCFVTQLFNIISTYLFTSFFFFVLLYCRWYWSHSRYRMGLHVTMWPDDDGSMSHCPPSRERCVYLFSVLVFFLFCFVFVFI